jgi:hypothetical protein
MFDFLDAKTDAVLHGGVSQPDDHMIHIGNKIEISEKDSVKQYRITDIVTPYRFTRGFLGGLMGPYTTRVYLELISS